MLPMESYLHIIHPHVIRRGLSAHDLSTCYPWSSICTRSITRSPSRTWFMSRFDCFRLLPFDQVKYKLKRSIFLLYGLHKIQFFPRDSTRFSSSLRAPQDSVFFYGLHKVQFFSAGSTRFSSFLRAPQGSVLFYGLHKIQFFSTGSTRCSSFLRAPQGSVLFTRPNFS